MTPPGESAAAALEAAKRAAGYAAAALVEPGMRVGLGTGSTVHWSIVALGERHAELGLTCVATSRRTEELAAAVGLKVLTPDEVGHLDITIDGADEVDGGANLTKGGGGAHCREKIVAAMAERFVVVVDASKLVTRLGPFGTPLEVLDFAPTVVASAVAALGATRYERSEHRSDNGNVLMRAYFPPIEEPAALAAALSAIAGVVEHGIFLGTTVDDIFVADVDGVRRLPGARPR